MPPSVLLIEDDPAFARRLQANLRAAGYTARIAPDGASALRLLKSEWFDLVVTDIRLPDIDGLEILERVKSGADGLDPDLPVMALTSVRDVETAVGAMRRGAADYLTKESENREILMRIQRALEQSALSNENRLLRDQLERQNEFREMVGQGPAMQAIKDEIAHLAGQSIPVLVTGETGVGKELVARALHRTGAHPKGPFVDLNCGALPDENLLLSELFGHERGAFTGATATKRGKFELARDGTLFLDEIGEMPLEAQKKILKAVESMRISRLGGNDEIALRCRLVFATNKNLDEEVRQGRFRQDLFYRVNLIPIHIPPLRERREDIPPLARFFLEQFRVQYGKPPRALSDEAVEILTRYDWPGNVRELRNVMERLAIRSRGETVGPDELRRCGMAAPSPAGAPIPRIPEGGVSLDEIERELVIEALRRCDWHQKAAAELLRISVDRMNSRVKKFGLTHPSWRVNK
jgi:DNA-binding NtrC family response regulator